MEFISPAHAGGRRRLFAVALAVAGVGALFACNGWNAKKQVPVPEGQNLLSVTVGSTTTSLIVWGLTSTAYSDPTAPPSTTTPSTSGPHAGTFVSVTLDASGLHAVPATAP